MRSPVTRRGRAYASYAKKTLERALPATRKRHAHLLANRQATEWAAEWAAESFAERG
jgi:hypothetical protein